MGAEGFSGNIVGGVIQQGDDVRIRPSVSTGNVAQVLTADGHCIDRADEGQPVTLMLEGGLAIYRGDIISGIDQSAQTADQFDVSYDWPLYRGALTTSDWARNQRSLRLPALSIKSTPILWSMWRQGSCRVEKKGYAT
ncbi:hypothetical protein ADS46_12260 [Halomonas sp. G11]|nr:hypothetical protein ADS46_12260 [Halomonas sp. G11]